MNNDKEIYIVGVGHNTGVTIDLVEASGFEVKGLIHYNHDLIGHEKWGFPIVAQTEDFLNNNIAHLNFALSMGDNQIRKDVFEKISAKGGNFPILIHPSAVVSRFSTLEIGVQIHANAIIQADCNINTNTMISFGTSIAHNTIIHKHCYIGGHSVIGAYTLIDELTFIGTGTVSISGKVQRIGKSVIVGAGSLITKSIEDNKTVYGRPAK